MNHCNLVPHKLTARAHPTRNLAQVDNQLYNARFPILIYPVFKVRPSCFRSFSCRNAPPHVQLALTLFMYYVSLYIYIDAQDLPDVTDKTMVPFLQFTLQRSTATDVDYFHAITFAMQEIEVRRRLQSDFRAVVGCCWFLFLKKRLV